MAADNPERPPWLFWPGATRATSMLLLPGLCVSGRKISRLTSRSNPNWGVSPTTPTIVIGPFQSDGRENRRPIGFSFENDRRELRLGTILNAERPTGADLHPHRPKVVPAHVIEKDERLFFNHNRGMSFDLNGRRHARPCERQKTGQAGRLY